MQGQPLHKWIKPLVKKTNGRIDMAALRAHYQVKGKTIQFIAEAEHLRDSFNYRNECALPFTSYLSKMEKMFTLFEEKKEPYSDSMKLWFLYDTIKLPQLMTTVSTLEVG